MSMCSGILKSEDTRKTFRVGDSPFSCSAFIFTGVFMESVCNFQNAAENGGGGPGEMRGKKDGLEMGKI